MNDDNPYRTPAAFRSAVDAKLRALARAYGRPFAELRREFLYQRFLARVFQEESLWVLKGGIGLLTRLPGARHSRDIDLLHLTAERTVAEAELRVMGRRDLGDHLRFEIVRSIPLPVEDALRLKTEVYAGASKWESFDIDVSCERPSNRYRDLVDLALLRDIEVMDAALLLSALRSREKNARSPVTLPTALVSPGAGWIAGYPAEARRSSLHGNLHHLDSALAYVGVWLNPILDGAVGHGTWRPGTSTWESPAEA